MVTLQFLIFWSNSHAMKKILVLMVMVGVFCGCKPTVAQLTSPENSNSTMAENTITVIGEAGNAKLGAHLHSDGGDYYIDQLQAWPDSMLGHKISVTGMVKEIDHAKEDLYNDRGEIAQGMVGKQRILMHATWRLAD